MNVLIVGGDQVESLKRQVLAQGHTHVEHWSGRKKGFLNRSLPSNTQLIVMVCDYVSHSLAISLKNKASRKGIPLVYCRHSTRELKLKLLNNGKINEVYCCYCIIF
ncbi:MAG: DUF2325 domain-containing protein [Nitrosomonas sp.]|nr:DUF2325 domain-containing protein [Nitrosomonas sp.]